MRIDKIHTPEQMREVFNTDKPRHVQLLDPKGETIVIWNSPKITAAKRWQDIEKELKKKNIPPGVYTVCFKTHYTNKGAVIEYPVGVGNWQGLQETKHTAIPVIKADEVWNSAQAMAEITKRLEAEATVRELTREVAELRITVAELEAEIREMPLQDDAPEKTWLESAKETLVPILDKVMDNWKQTNEVNQLRYGRGLRQRNDDAQQDHYRNDGGIKLESPHYESYLNQVINKGTPAQITHEIKFIQQMDPTLYQFVVTQYPDLAIQPAQN